MPKLTELIAEKLSEARVDVVFGLPGGENVDVLDALRRRGIEFVLVRNESSAIFMADTHARLTEGTGVALTTLGPGAANAYERIAHALELLRSGRPGPVHLSIPTAYASSEVADTPTSYSPVNASIKENDIARAKNTLASSRRPVII